MDKDFILIATAFLESVAKELDPYTSQKSQISTLSETQVQMLTPYLQYDITNFYLAAIPLYACIRPVKPLFYPAG